MTTPALWLDQAVGHHVEGDLTKMDALAVTAKIKAYAGVAWTLLVEAHSRKAHRALGYKSWAEYVEAEFDMSRSRSYQLISQARVVMEISEAVSTDVDISEAAARDLLPVIDEAKAVAVEAVESVPDDAPAEDKQAAVQDALDRLRTTAVASKRPTPAPAAPSAVVADAEGKAPGADQPASSPSVPIDPALKLAALLAIHRADVAKWLAFDRHQQVMDGMTAEQRSDYRSFVHSVWTHANATLDYLDAPARLKAVQ